MKKSMAVLILAGLFNSTAWAQASLWGGLLQGLAQSYARQQQRERERQDLEAQYQSLQALLDQLESQRREMEALALQRQPLQADEALVNEIRGMLAPLSPEGRDEAREVMSRVLESGTLDDVATKRAVIALTLLGVQPAPPPRSTQFGLERERVVQSIQNAIIATRLRSRTTEGFQETQTQPVGIPQGTVFTPAPALPLTNGFTGTRTNRFGTTTLHSWGSVSGTSTTIPMPGTITLHDLGGMSGTSIRLANPLGNFTLHNFSNGVSGTSNRLGYPLENFTIHNFSDGVSGTSNRLGGFTFHNFSNGRSCTSNQLGTSTFTNCY